MTDIGNGNKAGGNGNKAGRGNWFRGLFRGRNGDSRLRETIEEIIEEIGDSEGERDEAVAIGDDERVMLSNILRLRHLTAEDVMVPRADIVGIELDTDLDALIRVIRREGHSRLPVYRDNLDETVGFVHIKDALPFARGGGDGFKLSSITRSVLFVAPSMRVLDLLLEMRRTRVHMALVVDEFGGTDGLITTEDLVEEIVGEIEDEHDVAEGPKLISRPDGSLIADARATVGEFEELVGEVLTEEEREEIDTMGGLVFALAGRVPGRGELIVHAESGIGLEVMDADARRVKRLRLRNLPPAPERGGADT